MKHSTSPSGALWVVVVPVLLEAHSNDRSSSSKSSKSSSSISRVVEVHQL